LVWLSASQVHHAPTANHRKSAITAVGLRRRSLADAAQSTAAEVIGPLWDRFGPRATQVPKRRGHDMFGVIYGRPQGERNRPDELQYIAGVQVNGPGDLPEGMVAYTVPAGTFAAFIHRGPIQNLRTTIHEVYRVWLPQSAWQHAQIADIELYDRRFDCNNANRKWNTGFS
jgi:AraC family transcriptional regulator